MSMCPHCIAVGIGATLAVAPFVPAALRNIKGKLFRQTYTVQDAKKAYDAGANASQGIPEEIEDGR